ncbi:MAG: Two-component transcriptional response regulator, LuxR family [uncultured Acidimicrobiales bacterium]|uniref:Two-component transcriptional response regulator, LuxR family n=1 Tax=uncultured Acidimicrobiales bacterium TaxID=310071 RepID=A0A6J4I1R5_9ACTN|nr:MAG: Two-component transcriptional response regulator, LuxR family [uncultured Acidimicrobiales bacterium]
MPIRIVLAEDHYLVREGVRRLIGTEPELDLVASCADLPSLFTAMEEHLPDVVLTDIRMPPTGTDEGLQAADRLRELRPDAGVVLLSQYVDPQYALAFLEHGSRGRAYLLKEHVSDIDQLLRAIRAVSQGESFIDSTVIDALVAARSRTAASPLRHLTPREGEILSEMAQGKNNGAIAGSVVLSERAVEKHIGSIFSKLSLTEEQDVNRRVKAVLLFLAERQG